MRRTTPEGWNDISQVTTVLSGEAGIRAHADIRAEKVVQALVVVYYLRLYNQLQRSATVDVQAAAVQLQTGSKADVTQAAHNMPCNIKLGGRSVWDWIPLSTPNGQLLRHTVAGWFGSTVVLPSAVNKCDSLWEHRGLKDALANALQRIVADPTPGSTPNAALSTAFEAFRQRSRIALVDAQAHIRGKLAVEKNPDKQHELGAMSTILNLYSQELGQFSPEPTITAHLSQNMARQYAEALQTTA